MPLNKTGQKILSNMEKEYGKKKGTSVFYATKNKGKLPKVERTERRRKVTRQRVRKVRKSRR